LSADWERFFPLSLRTNLDSLGSLIGRTGDEHTRAHLVQEYVLAANRLDPPARRAALASVTKVLQQAGSR
jgi:hypothetical protein